MVFDLTDAASCIKSGQADSIYFIATDTRRDGKTGTILSSSVQYLDWGILLFSGSTTLGVSDNGDAAPAGHRIWQLDNDATADWIFTPVGTVGPETTYVPRTVPIAMATDVFRPPGPGEFYDFVESTTRQQDRTSDGLAGS
jgi:hypothetical protein